MAVFLDEEERVGQVNSTNQKDETFPIVKVTASGDQNEYINIGNSRVLKSELVGAFGGHFSPESHAPASKKFANPAPLGLSAFALTTFVLSLYNIEARGVTKPSVLLTTSIFYGGLIQTIAGIWEIVLGNTFGATAFASYGAFWMSYGVMLIPSIGVAESFETVHEFEQALGLWLTGWFIFTFLMCCCTIRSTISFFLMFLSVDIIFLLLAIGHFVGNFAYIRAAGWCGIVAAFLAWYNAISDLLTKENSFITLRPVFMPFSKPPKSSKTE